MRRKKIGIIVGCCLSAVAIAALAQATRKPGLWEVVSTMTWQQSPLPPGMTPPPGSPFGGAPRTTEVCVTQEMIDKFGGPPPQTRGDCQVSGITIKPNGMSASISCSGQVTGKGNVDASWNDADHAKSHIHFTGTMTMGSNSRPIEWTVEANSTYKGADCGDVKPITLPVN